MSHFGELCYALLRCACSLSISVPRPNAKRCWPFPRKRPNSCGITLLALTTSRLFVGVAAITTDQTNQGILLAQALVESLRKAKIIIPGLPVVERWCAEVVTRAQRRLYKRLTAPLSEDQKEKLETLLNVREGTHQTLLAWLRQPAGAPSTRNLLDHVARLQALRQVGLPAEIGRTVHQNHLLRLAREGAQTTVYHLRDFEVQRRQATLVAILLDTGATLIDEILDLHDRMVGSAFAKAKRAYEVSFQESGKAIK